MSSVHLDGRLSLCATYVREGSRLADIGTDHGYLPIMLVETGRCPTALACDINPSPLRSAAENIRRHGLCDRIATRLCDGLQGVSADDADDIVIAGMGGELIAEILASCDWIKDGDKRLILQPMTRYEKLTAWLYRSGFSILSQRAAYADRKHYTVICARYTAQQHDADLTACLLGGLDPNDPDSRAFLRMTADRIRKQCIGDPELLPALEELEMILC